MDMSGHDMGSSDSGDAACKINMMFNWYTIDACFLTEQWHIRSIGALVGSVIGVFLLVVALEAFRRLGRDYDRAIRRNYYSKEKQVVAALSKNNDSAFEVRPFRPTFAQHAVRSTFYLVQFSVSYILMLIAMYYNGFMLVAIFFGGFAGYLVCARDTCGDEDTPISRGECCA